MTLQSNWQRDRRLFLKAGSAAVAAGALGMSQRGSAQEGQETTPDAEAPVTPPSERISVGVMGVNGRGLAIAKNLISMEPVDITHICDVDDVALGRACDLIEGRQEKRPEGVGDIREMLDAQSLDAVFVAAPNHWHAPAAILGCEAGKHVYVEKPCCHNPAEGEAAVAAARKNNRIVQTGTQRRSWSAIMEGIQKLHDGAIGDILYARVWYNNRRGSINNGKPTDPPENLNWDLWQGPAPRRPYIDNVVHYNWHWHWHWGNGELGNNGVHGIDLARWGMQLTYPERVTASGGKYRHDDTQETPDTLMIGLDFDTGKTITWEGLSWSPLGSHDSRFGISFHGTDGSMVMRTAGYTTFDMRDQETGRNDGPADDKAHFQNFFDCMRTGELPRADIQIGHDSALLCHLGNIAYRTGSALEIDPTNGHIVNHPEAEAMWSREYDPEWQPKYIQ